MNILNYLYKKNISVYYIMDRVKSLEVPFNKNASKKIFIILKNGDGAFSLNNDNDDVDNLYSKLNDLCSEIFFTEYIRFNFDFSGEYICKNSCIFFNIYRITLSFNLTNPYGRISIDSSIINYTVDSRKYFYIYDDIVKELNAILEKINIDSIEKIN